MISKLDKYDIAIVIAFVAALSTLIWWIATDISIRPTITIPNTPDHSDCIRSCMISSSLIRCDVDTCSERALGRNCLLTCGGIIHQPK